MAGDVLPDDTVRVDVEPIRRAEIVELENRYGVTAWFGHHTRAWWALDGGRLVEGKTPDRLGEAVLVARWAEARRWAP